MFKILCALQSTLFNKLIQLCSLHFRQTKQTINPKIVHRFLYIKPWFSTTSNQTNFYYFINIMYLFYKEKALSDWKTIAYWCTTPEIRIFGD